MKKKLWMSLAIMIMLCGCSATQKGNQHYLFYEKTNGSVKAPYLAGDSFFYPIDDETLEFIKNDSRCISLNKVIQFPTFYLNEDKNEMIGKGEFSLYKNGQLVKSFDEVSRAYRIVSYIDESYIANSCSKNYQSTDNNTDHLTGYLDNQLLKDLGLSQYFENTSKESKFTIEATVLIPIAYKGVNKRNKCMEYEYISKTLTIDLKGISNNHTQGLEITPAAIYLNVSDMQKIIDENTDEDINQNIWLIETSSKQFLQEIQEKNEDYSIYRNIW